MCRWNSFLQRDALEKLEAAFGGRSGSSYGRFIYEGPALYPNPPPTPTSHHPRPLLKGARFLKKIGLTFNYYWFIVIPKTLVYHI